jgi:hypothetical protein
LFALRIIKSAYRTVNDAIVPETPEYQTNTTGDLAVLDTGINGIPSLPIRLAVGNAGDRHHGFGLRHILDGGQHERARLAPAVTEDIAENSARHVVSILAIAKRLYQEGDRLTYQSWKTRESLVLQEKNNSSGHYYSVVTVLPSSAKMRGALVWRGSVNFPTMSSQETRAPVLSSGRETLRPDRPPPGVQTERFDANKPEGGRQVAPKVEIRRRRNIEKPKDPL